MSMPKTQPSSPITQEPSLWLWGAMMASLIALAGSLDLSLGMGLKACPLCLYQRTFIMGVVGVLAVGFFVKDLQPKVLCLLALPVAVAALGVAAFHCYL
jgi:disulfide bond formation protein DsbB